MIYIENENSGLFVRPKDRTGSGVIAKKNLEEVLFVNIIASVVDFR